MRLIVAPLHDAAEAIGAFGVKRVVSLASPVGDIANVPADVARLVLRFHDIAQAQDGLIPARKEDVARLLQFAGESSGDMVIQCWAGVSRSTAAAYAVACARSASGTEMALAYRLRAASKWATPNPLVVKLADQLLRREGRMVKAVSVIGRGADVGLGSVFVLNP